MKEFVHNFCCDTLTKHHVNEKPSESVKKKAVTASSDKGEDDDDVGVLSFDLPGVLAEKGGGGGCSGRKQMSLLSSIIELLLGREHL